MKDYNKMVGFIVIAILFTIVINIVTLLILNNSINEIKTRYLNETSIECKKQEAEDQTEEKDTINTDAEQSNKQIESNDIITGKNSIGTIKINRINFKGNVYEGTSLDILEKGVGHFDNSPYLDGNVCLAAHNTNKFWAKLKTLRKGDIITYESFLGTREYKVSEVNQIDETDWTKLENTNENTLTMITCVKGNRPKRLCVRAIAI